MLKLVVERPPQSPFRPITGRRSSLMGERIKVILRKVQINDNLEPFFKDEGEFRFTVRVSGRDGLLRETRIPKEGYFEITDHPSWNQRHLNEVVYEGEAGDHLEVEVLGEELDDFSANDHLTPYKRVFTGPPSSWVGLYRPGDEGPDDPEMMRDWWVFLEILEA
jgi:hypothetical protein